MKRLPVLRHRTARQAWTKYRACRCPVAKVRWHALWLLLRTDEPRTPAQVAAVVGLAIPTVRALLHRWNQDGPAGLLDRRAGNGAQPRLNADQRRALFAALQQRSPDGGLWTGPKVTAYVHDRWGVTVCLQTGWQWLRDLGFTVQVPRPRHPQAAPEAQRRRWKTPPPPAGAAAPASPSGESR